MVSTHGPENALIAQKSPAVPSELIAIATRNLSAAVRRRRLLRRPRKRLARILAPEDAEDRRKLGRLVRAAAALTPAEGDIAQQRERPSQKPGSV